MTQFYTGNWAVRLHWWEPHDFKLWVIFFFDHIKW